MPELLISTLSSQQAFLLCNIVSALASAVAATRLLSLPSRSGHRLFIGLFTAWVLPSLLPFVFPVSSPWYFAIYVFLSPVSWLLYIFVSRDIYQKLFGKYQGIAFAGRTCLHVSLACLLISMAFGLYYFDSSVRGQIFSNFTSIDRSVHFGLSFFLLFVVVTIVRYPMPIARNLIVHCLFFSATLLAQSLFSFMDLVSSYHYSMLCNTLLAVFSTILVGSWALVLTKAGDTETIRIRRNIQPALAIQLLGELDSINMILLRATTGK